MPKSKTFSKNSTSPEESKLSPNPKADTSLDTNLLSPSEQALLEDAIRSAIKMTERDFPEIHIVKH